MRMISKLSTAAAAFSLAAIPVVAQAAVRPAPVKITGLSDTRLGTQPARFGRAGAAQGESDHLALGLLPLLGVFVGVAVVVFVAVEVTGNSSPS